MLVACAKPEAPDPRRLSAGDSRNLELSWPPMVGQPYPDVTVVFGDGRLLRLSSLKGKVLLIEPVGMTCPACQSMAGANLPGVGPMPGQSAESGPPVEDWLLDAGIDPASEDLIYVQLLLYNLKMKAATAADAGLWERHFTATRFKRRLVVSGGEGLLRQGSYELIPGLQVVDRDFVLRADWTGHQPQISWEALMAELRRAL